MRRRDEREREALLRTRHPDVREAALLLEQVVVVARRGVRQRAVLQPARKTSSNSSPLAAWRVIRRSPFSRPPRRRRREASRRRGSPSSVGSSPSPPYASRARARAPPRGARRGSRAAPRPAVERVLVERDEARLVERERDRVARRRSPSPRRLARARARARGTRRAPSSPARQPVGQRVERLEERDAFFDVARLERLERRCSDAARRDVDDPPERHVVVSGSARGAGTRARP